MKRTAPPTAFKPGQSGNPRGRPKRDAEVAEMARVHTADALDTLSEVMRDAKAPASARVMAANALLDRGHGKAPLHLTTERLDLMTDAELNRMLKDSLLDLHAQGVDMLALFAEGQEEEEKKRPH